MLAGAEVGLVCSRLPSKLSMYKIFCGYHKSQLRPLSLSTDQCHHPQLFHSMIGIGTHRAHSNYKSVQTHVHTCNPSAFEHPLRVSGISQAPTMLKPTAPQIAEVLQFPLFLPCLFSLTTKRIPLTSWHQGLWVFFPHGEALNKPYWNMVRGCIRSKRHKYT